MLFSNKEDIIEALCFRGFQGCFTSCNEPKEEQLDLAENDPEEAASRSLASLQMLLQPWQAWAAEKKVWSLV